MSSGFLLADALAEALRKPYHQGDTNITVQYLVEGLKIGEYRVMLKRNFDTACWVPPVGSRGSHSIYYGDRMLDRIFDRFCKVEGVAMPETKVFVEQVKATMAAAKAAPAPVPVKGKQPSKRTASVPPMTQVFNLRLEWLKTNLSPAQWAKLIEWLLLAVASYGRHEREHARQTIQDLKQVNKDLDALKIPFSLFNLFEDSRIEHISRQELGINFDWMVFEDIAPATNPFNLYLRCIQLEGEADQEALDSETPFDKDGARTIGHVAESVETYYQRACGCTTSEQLYPVIVEFLEEFKNDLPPPPEDEGGEGGGSKPGKGGEEGEGEGESGSKPGEPGEGGESEEEYTGAGERAGDLSTAAEAADKGDDFFSEFESDTEVVGGTDAAGQEAEAKAKGKLKDDGQRPPNPKAPPGQGIPESITPQASGGRAEERYFLTDYPGELDAEYKKRVVNLTATLMRMFKTHSLPAATETPGRRMSGRHLAQGELRFIHKKVFGGKGKRKYDIVYDCSGSMSGRPDREGKLFLLALNNLARRGFLEGSLILSGWVGGRPGWLSYQFPVKDELILRIHPHHQSEGLQSALADNLKSLIGKDDVFVYTDACICDEPLNRGFFASRRVWPVGLYVGSDRAAATMEQHFPQNIIRNTIEELVEAMLIRNRRTVG